MLLALLALLAWVLCPKYSWDEPWPHSSAFWVFPADGVNADFLRAALGMKLVQQCGDRHPVSLQSAPGVPACCPAALQLSTAVLRLPSLSLPAAAVTAQPPGAGTECQ